MVFRIHNHSVTFLNGNKVLLQLSHLLERLLYADRTKLVEVVYVDSVNRLGNVISNWKRLIEMEA